MKAHQADAVVPLLFFFFSPIQGKNYPPDFLLVFQLAIYFQYQPICVLALAVQWGFLLEL